MRLLLDACECSSKTLGFAGIRTNRSKDHEQPKHPEKIVRAGLGKVVGTASAISALAPS